MRASALCCCQAEPAHSPPHLARRRLGHESTITPRHARARPWPRPLLMLRRWRAAARGGHRRDARSRAALACRKCGRWLHGARRSAGHASVAAARDGRGRGGGARLCGRVIDLKALARLHTRTDAVRVTGTEPRRHFLAVTTFEPTDATRASASVLRTEQLWQIEHNLQTPFGTSFLSALMSLSLGFMFSPPSPRLLPNFVPESPVPVIYTGRSVVRCYSGRELPSALPTSGRRRRLRWPPRCHLEALAAKPEAGGARALAGVPRDPTGKGPPYWAPWPVCAGGLRAGKAAPARAGGDPGFGKGAQDLRAGHAPSGSVFSGSIRHFF